MTLARFPRAALQPPLLLARCRSVALALLVLPLLTMQFPEEAHGASLLDSLPNINHVSNAKVVLLSPAIDFQMSSGEGHLNPYGCTYTTQDDLRIRSLINLLKLSHLRIDKPSYRGVLGEPTVRVVLDGTGIEFYFYGKYVDGKVRGYFHEPGRVLKSTGIIANGALYDDLGREPINWE